MNYRYVLRREWMGSGGIVNWLMLNPSTADDVSDDPTIRKCCGFAKRWGYQGIVVTNLFAYRSTDPKEMKSLARADYALAVGDNDAAITEHANASAIVIAAWGVHGPCCGRDQYVMHRLVPHVDLYCIGKTKDGHPLHPCMAGYTDAPVLFSERIQPETFPDTIV